MTDNESDPIRRRVQLAGGATFTLSLPRDWALSQDIEKGEDIYLYRERDRLVVAPSTLEEHARTTEIDATNRSDVELEKHIKGAYVEGYERITVSAEDGLTDEDRLATNRTVDALIGMEVEESREDSVVVRDHLDANAISLEQSVVQVRQLALGMLDDAVEAVRMNDEMLARHVVERDDHVDRLFAFVARGLHCGLNDMNELARFDVDRKAALYYYKIAQQLEGVADTAERLADVTDVQSTRPEDALGDEFTDLVGLARDVVEYALNDDSEAAIDTYEKVCDRMDALERDLARRDSPDAYWYSTVVECIRQTAQAGVKILNLTVETSVNDMLYSEAGSPVGSRRDSGA
jgi:phosphate uptake regulator